MVSGTFKGWDLTQGWVRGEDAHVLVDFDTHRLCGVGLDDPLRGLSALGPPDAAFPDYDDARKHIVGSHYYYRRWGLTLFAVDDQLDSWQLEMAIEGDAPLPRAFRYQGQTLALVTESDLRSHFGEAYFSGRSGGETEGDYDLFYESSNIEWLFELTADGQLQTITMQRPILADPDVRNSYRITKPWPP